MTFAELDAFLETEIADYGLMSTRARQLIQELKTDDEDKVCMYFASKILEVDEGSVSATSSVDIKEAAAISYRSMKILKDDIEKKEKGIIVGTPGRASLLVKSLCQGLGKLGTGSNHHHTPTSGNAAAGTAATNSFRIVHVRCVLEALLENYPSAIISAVAAGGTRGLETNLRPLLLSGTALQTLPFLTQLVCYGCTGRRGMASAEKSAQHTYEMAQRNMFSNNKKLSQISNGHRRKFVKNLADWGLMTKLAQRCSGVDTYADADANINTNANEDATTNTSAVASTEQSAGSIPTLGVEEEACEATLTILECVGYPPLSDAETVAAATGQTQKLAKKADSTESVGEDVLLRPLGTPEWWHAIFVTLQELLDSNTSGDWQHNQRAAAIARVAYQAFALATGNSSRICKSHAPATDATEQADEKIVTDEEEDSSTNRLMEWGLTDKMHAALITQLPLLIQLLGLPIESLQYEATWSTAPTTAESKNEGDPAHETNANRIRHPGKYETKPFSSWRHQLLMLLTEVISYGTTVDGIPSQSKSDMTSASKSPALRAMESIMAQTRMPPEVEKKKKHKKSAKQAQPSAEASQGDVLQAEASDTAADKVIIYNPWPALCSFIFAYPHNDLYHIQFYRMFVAVCMEHEEQTLRLVLQKAKFVTRAIRACNNDAAPSPARAVLWNCLNVLRLRRDSLPPSAYLRQFLDSHDIWKGFLDTLIQGTIRQQTPIAGATITVAVGDVEQTTAVTDESTIGLDTAYAKQLGLEGVCVWDGKSVMIDPSASATTLSQQLQAVNLKQDGTNAHDDDVTIGTASTSTTATSSTAGGSSSSKKKKKKRKKK